MICRASIVLMLLLSFATSAQARKNFAYSSFLKFPNSYYNVGLGWDRSIQLSPKDWSSERFYLVFSPNLMWSGYKFNELDGQEYLSTRFEKYEVTLPIHVRFEYAPYRINLKSSRGKPGNDVALFFDAGVSVNYMLGSRLKEDYNYATQSSTFKYVFDEALTPTVSNRTTISYLHVNIGVRIHRFLFFLRSYGSFKETQYKDLSPDWNLPAGTHSFFFQEYLKSDYLKQNRQFNLLCIGYTF